MIVIVVKIRINSVHPGTTKTPILNGFEEFVEPLRARASLGRFNGKCSLKIVIFRIIFIHLRCEVSLRGTPVHLFVECMTFFASRSKLHTGLYI